MSAGAETAHRPECWCNGTGRRLELGHGVRCNLPQLTDSEIAYLSKRPENTSTTPTSKEK